MAKVKGSSNTSPQRVSPMKPGLSGARNWASSQVRAATYTRQAFLRLVLSILFIFALITYCALWFGGFLPNAREAGAEFKRARLMSMGFVVKRVDVMGEGRLRESEVRDTLGVRSGDYLFDLNTRSAQARIESLSWVDHAVVRRLWPDRVVVQIVERRPYALWQNDGVVKVVDLEGRPIEDAKIEEYYALPLVVGSEAALHAASIQAELKAFPALSKRVEALVRVNDLHWNLQMNAGQLWVQISNKDAKRALQKLDQLQKDQQILNRQISNIDLRLNDRITLTPYKPQRA